jgi:PAS domain S-box-containing protein
MGDSKGKGTESPAIRVAGINIEWRPRQGTCTFEKLPVALMWVDTTLAGLLSGVQAMVGTPRFLLALQSEGRKSVEADWRVISSFPDFRQGFAAIANIAAVAGWGHWELTSLEESRREARFRVKDSWEGGYQKALGVCWGSGMLAGKLAGYCSKHFETNCWADQTAFIAAGDPHDEFVVRPSSRSIEKEIEGLLASDAATRADMAVALRTLEMEIAERRHAEEALRESEEKYRVLVENAEEAISVAQDGILRFANRKTAELTGYSREDLTSRPFVEFLHPDDRAVVHDRHVKRQQGVELPNNYRFRIAHKSGETRWVDLNVVMIEWEGKSATLNFMTDITERRQAEAALQRSQTLFATIFRTSPAATILSTLADGRCVDANEAYSRLFGHTREELVGHTTTELNIWLSPEQRQQVVTELSRHRHLENVELTLRTKSGALRNTVAAGEIITIEGQPYILSFFFDITERKRAEAERIELERQLLHAQKLKSLGILAGGIAHDFNNLLMAILGNLDLALLNVPQTSPVRVNIEQAVQATRRATDLTRQLLAYSGKGRFVVTRMDLNRLVRESADLFRTAIAKTITMQLHLAPEPSVLEADPGQVQQVIINLITNASEAIGDQPGRITLTTGSQTCDAGYLSRSRLAEKPPAGQFVYLEVSDTGCGMNEETLQHLFDPFFTTKFMGRGLGMSAVLGIVRGHKGAILVESAIGQGTTIRVLFPACTAALEESPDASRAPVRVRDTAVRKGTVLVVDDEGAVRTLGIAFVQRLGFEAMGAADGEEALRLFEAHAREITCVLLDLTMPRMDGLSTFREMKRLQPGVKVILCSGYDEQEATQRFSTEGLAGFIQKPYLLQDLRVMIEQILKGPA